jgi:hypothetical protein
MSSANRVPSSMLFLQTRFDPGPGAISKARGPHLHGHTRGHWLHCAGRASTVIATITRATAPYPMRGQKRPLVRKATTHWRA